MSDMTDCNDLHANTVSVLWVSISILSDARSPYKQALSIALHLSVRKPVSLSLVPILFNS